MKTDQERLKELFDYNPVSGEFTRKIGRGPAKAGEKAGCDNGLGYVRIPFQGKLRLRSHLAWLYMTGEWPVMQIDHKDQNSRNDAWENLRHVTQAVNMQNMREARATNKTGFLGVSPDGQGKFRATITVEGKQVWLGAFDTPESAHQAYLNAKDRLHPGSLL